jgi:hypothetical protein
MSGDLVSSSRTLFPAPTRATNACQRIRHSVAVASPDTAAICSLPHCFFGSSECLLSPGSNPIFFFLPVR